MTFSERLLAGEANDEARLVDVLVSYDVIKLFSDQLYTTPVKAIEELVVNAWDADARLCSVIVGGEGGIAESIVVFDNGNGMTVDELENLWHIGVSEKPGTASERKQIGKFGIGKLASYAVARRATYISKTPKGVHAVTIDFEDFATATDKAGKPTPVPLSIRKYGDIAELLSQLEEVGALAALTVETVDGKGVPFPLLIDLADETTWTLVLLEDLKPKAQQLKGGRLRWVLETAMPLAADFKLFLDHHLIVSSKERIKKAVSFSLADLDESRIASLTKSTGEAWSKTVSGVMSPSFPSGISGEAFVTDRSLYAEGGKSEDLGRSHGFFVRVRNRLINETDPLFGARPLSFSTWYRFAAVVEAEDLHDYVTAARDDVEQSDMKQKLRAVLIEVFNQARDRFEDHTEAALKAARVNKEGSLDYVRVDLVERPIADAIAVSAENRPSGDGPTNAEQSLESWRYLEDLGDLTEVQTLLGRLYDDDRVNHQYKFRYAALGRQGPLVRLNPIESSFTLNEDHELTQEFGEAPESRKLLETVAAAEALFEVYLRQSDMDASLVSHLMDRRDLLLRSLARDESSSLRALAQSLRDAVSNAVELEIALVGALRALGFAASHIGGPGTPDGAATFLLHGSPNQSITLEAKSSADVPGLPQLDFGGLKSHYVRIEAAGCLLVAPSYPGAEDPKGEVSHRAGIEGVSCWTVEQLAQVVEAAESRRINAKQIEEIVLTRFTPLDVTAAIEDLLTKPAYSERDVIRAALDALRSLAPRLKKSKRNVSMVAAEVSRVPELEAIDEEEIRSAIDAISKMSRGILHLTQDGEIQVLGDLDELERRVSSIAPTSVGPRRRGSFRDPAS